MRIIDDMLHRSLRMPERQQAVSRWVSQPYTPGDILQVPSALWMPVQRAGDVMDMDQAL